MKLVAQVKLVVEKEHVDVLTRTLAAMNQAANEVSSVAWQQRVFARVGLQRICYHQVKDAFGLGAQAAIHVARKVSDPYRLDKNTRKFWLDGAVTYDDRMLSWNLDSRTVSIWTVAGRLSVRFVGGERSLKLLNFRKGETDLILRDGMWFLSATCDSQEPEALFGGSVLGIDRGIANIATGSNGMNFTGKGVNRVRHRNEQLRARLQHKGQNLQNDFSKRGPGRSSDSSLIRITKPATGLYVRLNAPDQVLPWKIYTAYETGQGLESPSDGITTLGVITN